MYGRMGELARLNSARNDASKPRFVRQQADKAHAAIVRQMKDKKLMRMRLRLIKASQAGDLAESNKIQVAMKAYAKEDREIGA